MDLLGPPPSASPDRERLLLFLRRVLALAIAFALLDLAAAAWLREWRLVAAAGLLLGVCGTAALAQRLARRGALAAAAEITGYTLLGFAVSDGWCLPFANAASLMVPVLAVTVSLPHLTGPRLRSFMIMSLATELAVVSYQVTLQPTEPPGAAFRAALVIAGATAAASLSFLLLTNFTRRLQELAHRAHEGEQRAHLVKSVAAALSQAPSAGDVAGATLAFSCGLFDSPAGCVLVREEGGALRTVACLGPAFEVDPAPVVSGDRETWISEARDDLGASRAICAALSIGQRTLGALAVRLPPDGAPARDSQELLVAMARLCAQALDRARLYDEVTQSLRLRDDFLSIAGHELKTPVTALQLVLQNLVRRPVLDERTCREEGQKLMRQVGRLSRLIERLLDVSRITAGRLELNPEAVELRALVAEVVDRHAGELRQSGSRCVLAPGGDVVGQWDRLRLEQVATNLLANAIKYGEGKPIEVSVARDTGGATLTVRDHGLGISAEDQRRIFQRFERAVSGRHFGGLGLGLWIVRQVVEAMGGSIDVASRPGEGSTFAVHLPAGRPHEGA